MQCCSMKTLYFNHNKKLLSLNCLISEGQKQGSNREIRAMENKWRVVEENLIHMWTSRKEEKIRWNILEISRRAVWETNNFWLMIVSVLAIRGWQPQPRDTVGRQEILVDCKTPSSRVEFIPFPETGTIKSRHPMPRIQESLGIKLPSILMRQTDTKN